MDGSSGPVMPVRDVERGDISENLLNPPAELRIADLPQPVSHPVGRGEGVEALPLHLLPQNRSDLPLVPVSHENGPRVRAHHLDVAHPVRLLLRARVLVLFHHAAHIVVHCAAGRQSRLAPAVLGQLIDIVGLVGIPLVDALLLHLPEKLSRVLVGAGIVDIHLFGKHRLLPVDL